MKTVSILHVNGDFTICPTAEVLVKELYKPERYEDLDLAKTCLYLFDIEERSGESDEAEKIRWAIYNSPAFRTVCNIEWYGRE